MGKRNLTLYVDDINIQIAKTKNLNLSDLFNELLKIENELEKLNPLSKDDIISKLKLENTKLSCSLNLCNKERDNLLKQIKQIEQPKEELIFRDGERVS